MFLSFLGRKAWFKCHWVLLLNFWKIFHPNDRREWRMKEEVEFFSCKNLVQNNWILFVQTWNSKTIWIFICLILFIVFTMFEDDSKFLDILLFRCFKEMNVNMVVSSLIILKIKKNTNLNISVLKKYAWSEFQFSSIGSRMPCSVNSKQRVTKWIERLFLLHRAYPWGITLLD